MAYGCTRCAALSPVSKAENRPIPPSMMNVVPTSNALESSRLTLCRGARATLSSGWMASPPSVLQMGTAVGLLEQLLVRVVLVFKACLAQCLLYLALANLRS